MTTRRAQPRDQAGRWRRVDTERLLWQHVERYGYPDDGLIQLWKRIDLAVFGVPARR